MSRPIPTYELATLMAGAGPVPGLFFSHQSPRPAVRIDLPYRSGYYKIGICLRGHAQLKVNLDVFDVGPASLVLTTPHSIKQWLRISPDYHAVDVFLPGTFSSPLILTPTSCPALLRVRPLRCRCPQLRPRGS